MKTIITCLILMTALVNLRSQTEYKNEVYGFSVQVPSEWVIYGELKDDMANNRSIIDWGMPKVYSELEKTEIENAVTITAYKRDEIKNVEDLIELEYRRLGTKVKSHEVLDSGETQSHILNTVIRGLEYKTKCVFLFKNKVAYVVAFTATPGTYDINISKFDTFIKGIRYFVPKERE